jgi:hypothetical protein
VPPGLMSDRMDHRPFRRLMRAAFAVEASLPYPATAEHLLTS